jgi:hypothetical protein
MFLKIGFKTLGYYFLDPLNKDIEYSFMLLGL